MRTNLFNNAKWLLVVAFATLSVQLWATDVEFTPANCTDMDNSEGTQTQTRSSVELEFYGVNNGDDLRTYKSRTLTITAPSGYNITSIVITCSASGTSKGGPGCFGAGAPSGYSYDGDEGTWTGSAASVEFYTTDNQVRATSILVTITASTTYAVTWKSDGVTVHTDAAVPSGTTVSVPSAPSVPSGCAGGVFMGWTATENYSANSAPGDLFTSTSPAITAATTFYAVFADPE